MKKLISASLMCADWMNLEKSIRELEEVGIDWLHCDMMDGHFVPNWMMFPDLINAIGANTRLPLDIHLMVSDPMAVLPRLKLRPGAIVAISQESVLHLQRALTAVCETGAQVGLALNPGTPLCMAEEVLSDIDLLLIMTVNPGYAGQQLVPNGLDKIARARAMLDKAGYQTTRIQVDGNCSFDNVPNMIKAGADVVVAGTSSVFAPGLTLNEGTAKLRALM